MKKFKEDQLFILLLEKSLKMLVENDISLIKRNLHEDCISYRLALYLSKNIKMISDKLSVDVQYNRNIDHPKYQEDESTRMRPDILIHERENNNWNVAAFENKKENLEDRDKEKLWELLNEDYDYRYEYCCSILYKPTKESMKILIMKRSKYYILSYSKKNCELVKEEVNITESTGITKVPDSFV